MRLSQTGTGWVPRARPLVRVVSPAPLLVSALLLAGGRADGADSVLGVWLSAWGLGSAVRPAARSDGRRSAMRECAELRGGLVGGVDPDADGR
jgi:hypothetical protein